jgi:sugar/nucleoside kinase (ribokinase family)
MKQNNIDSCLFQGSETTGTSIVLISPDSERTMATYLGAAIELKSSDLTLDLFSDYDYFHLEGYLVQNHPLVEQAAKLSKKANNLISIDLASFNIVEENLLFLHSIVDKYVDIVFSNEEEAKAFTGKSNTEEALVEISKKCMVAIVKIGKDGSIISREGGTYKIPPAQSNAIDTTGAGDLYASGFFYGLAKGYPLELCGRIGSIVGGEIVEVVGPKMNKIRWENIKKNIKKVERSFTGST